MKGLALAVVVLTACGDDDGGSDPTFGPEASTGEIGGSTSTNGSGSGSGSTGPEGSDSSGSGSSSSGAAPIPDFGDPGCLAPTEHLVCDRDASDPFEALGIGCPGDASDSTAIVDSRFAVYDDRSWAVVRQLGSGIDPDSGEGFWIPREGDAALLLTTGRVDPPNADGILLASPSTTEYGSANANPDNQSLPPPLVAAAGSGGTPFVDCDGVGDCSDTLATQWEQGGAQGHDLVWLGFTVDVPAGTYGYTLDFAWFTAEYPEWIGSVFNDMLVVWASSEAYTGALTFVDDAPLTVTAMGETIHDGGRWGDDASLVGTGFDGWNAEAGWCDASPYAEHVSACPTGGATGWYTATGPVQPGETLELVVALFDMGDELWDSAALLDNFQWSCIGCDAGEGECGIKPAG